MPSYLHDEWPANLPPSEEIYYTMRWMSTPHLEIAEKEEAQKFLVSYLCRRHSPIMQPPFGEASSIGDVITFLRQCRLDKSADRIAYLFSLEETDDLEEGSNPLSLKSAIGFAVFMDKFKDLGEPRLGLFPQGTLSAGWRIADDKHLLVELLDDRHASFALIAPATRFSRRRRRMSGSHMPFDEVIESLRNAGVDRWNNS